MSAPATDRDLLVAREALRRRLVTKPQAEECLRVARELAKRGQARPLEELFSRKGYVKPPEAAALARTVGSGGKLELEEEKRAKCPACAKDPGHGDDCARCGADLVTGGPGPNATVCGTCGKVVLRGSAVCPRCAAPIESAKRAHRGRSVSASASAAGLIERALVIAAAAGVAYFLVWRPFLATKDEPPSPPDERSPAERALASEKDGDARAALDALEEAARAPDHDPSIDASLAFALRAAGRIPEAREAVARARRGKDDRSLAMLEVDLLLAQAQLDEAARSLDAIAERDDAYWRARARLARLREDAAAERDALARIQKRTPAESRPLAEPLLARAAELVQIGDGEKALAAAREAVALDPTWPRARERLGQALLACNKPADARGEFEKAILSDPDDPAARLGLALALERAGDRTGAARSLGDFIARARANPALAAQVKAAEVKKKTLEK